MTTIRLMLRCDSYRDTGDVDEYGVPVSEFVPAFHEDVDLAVLTPRARSLAEALAQQKLGFMGLTDILMGCEEPESAFPQSEESLAVYGRRPSRRVFTRSRFRSSDGMTAVEYLEREARSWPMDWYVIGAEGCDPVPSMQAGREDRAYTHHMAMEHLHVSPQAWDLLTKAGNLPAPDRWAGRQPQWLPQTIDAYRTRPVKLWTVSEISAYLGQSTGSARKWLSRMGLSAAGREPGRAGQSLYASDQVTAVRTYSPGSGRRGAARVGGRFAADSPGY